MRIHAIKPTYFEPKWKPWSSEYYWGYTAYLPAFAGAPASAVITRYQRPGGTACTASHDSAPLF